MKGSRKKFVAGIAVVVAVAIQAGCTGHSAVTKKSPEKAAAEVSPVILAGKVVETMDAGAYTYVLLEKDSKKGWSAIPTTKVSVGQELQIRPGTEMGKFTSRTLKRTFDNIVFSPGVVTEQAELPPAHPAMEKSSPSPAAPTAEGKSNESMESMMKGIPGHGAMTGGADAGSKSAATISGKVLETMAAGGYTYIYLDKGGEKVWVAVPPATVAVGDQVEVFSGMPMEKFTSKSLNRTFDTIIFSSGIVPKK